MAPIHAPTGELLQEAAVGQKIMGAEPCDAKSSSVNAFLIFFAHFARRMCNILISDTPIDDLDPPNL